jgi:hypothetical protein
VECGVWVHIAVVVLFLAGALVRVRQVRGQYEGREAFVEMLRAVAWPSHPWFPTVLACLTPINYAVWPPSVPERERLMGVPGKNGVRYARAEAKKQSWSLCEVGFPQMLFVFVVAVGGLFVASWWI